MDAAASDAAAGLTPDQVAHYREHGYLVLENRVPPDVITRLRAEIARLSAPARTMTASDDRLDLEDSHRPDAPRVRRIKLPHLQSAAVRDLMLSDCVLAPARALLGPDIRLHTTTLNMKSAGHGAPIAWHQDFAFYPHTNDDVLAVAVIIDDMAVENGPLTVFPGSHRGPVHDHHAGGVFAGALDLAATGLTADDAVPLTAPAGSLSIHHGRIIHGSAENRSARDRRLLFFEMMAADAFPVMGSMTRFSDIEDYNSRLLCGRPTPQPRLAPVPVRIPQPQPARNKSIYEIQRAAGAPVTGAPATGAMAAGDDGRG